MISPVQVCRVLCALAALSCASSPEPTFYALSAIEEAPQVREQALRVELRRAVVPGYLDRPQLVRRVSSQRLQLSSSERWGAPLQELVSGTLAENLSAQLPASEVYTENSTISSDADVVIDIELRRFELDAQGQVNLTAVVATQFLGPQPRTTRRDYKFLERPASSSADDVVATMSELLAQLSGAIAQQLAGQRASAR